MARVGLEPFDTSPFTLPKWAEIRVEGPDVDEDIALRMVVRYDSLDTIGVGRNEALLNDLMYGVKCDDIEDHLLRYFKKLPENVALSAAYETNCIVRGQHYGSIFGDHDALTDDEVPEILPSYFISNLNNPYMSSWFNYDGRIRCTGPFNIHEYVTSEKIEKELDILSHDFPMLELRVQFFTGEAFSLENQIKAEYEIDSGSWRRVVPRTPITQADKILCQIGLDKIDRALCLTTEARGVRRLPNLNEIAQQVADNWNH